MFAASHLVDAVELKLPPLVPSPKTFTFNLGPHLSDDQRSRALSPLEAFRHICATDISQCTRSCVYEASLPLKPDHIVRWIPQYRLSPPELDHAQEYVAQLLKYGVIVEGSSCYNSPLFCIPKRKDKPSDPTVYRVILSLKAVNSSCLKRTNFALPSIPDLLSNLAGKSWHSSFDLTSSFHQVNLTMESSKVCSFSLQGKQYLFRRLPLGVNSAVHLLSSILAKALEGLFFQEVFGFVDDLFCSTHTIDQMLDLLRRTFEKLDTAHLYLNPLKSSFFYG